MEEKIGGMVEMNELQKLKVHQLAIDEYLFNGQEPEQELRFLREHFNNDSNEVNDLLKWRKEDKEYFSKKLKNLLKIVEESGVEEEC